MNIKPQSRCLFSLLLLISIPFTTLSAEDTKKIILMSSDDVSVTKYEALMMFEHMNYSQRERLSNNAGKFNSLLVDFINEKKKTNEAIKQELDKQELIQWKIEKAKSRILSDQLITKYRNNIVVPEDIKLLAKEYYSTHPEDFTSEEEIKVAHILLSTNADQKQKDKDELFEKLTKIASDISNDKLTFEEAANLHSNDKGSASKGGVINFFTRGKMVKEFELAAFNLKSNGDVSQIIESQYGYHLIKLLERKESAIKPFEEVEAVLVESESTKYIKSQTRSYSDTFSINKNLQINADEINNILIETKKATPSRLLNK